MPPSNSRNTSPPAADPANRAALPPSYFSALQDLESPVLNLAATLTTQAEDDITETNAQYFPSEDGLEDWSERVERMARERQRWQQLQQQQQQPSPPRPRPQPQVPQRREDLDQRERLRRVMNRLSRIHDPPATASYGDRIPSQNNLYDWSPANEADDEDELDQILAELRREQPNTHPEILRVLGRSQLDAERESRTRSYSSRLLSSNQPSQTADSSLRSAAILQSVRRHPRFSARTRDYMQRYPQERESASRSPHQSEPRERHSSSTESARQAAMQRLNDRRTSADRTRDRDRDILSRVNSFRRNYLDGQTASAPPPVSPLLEQTINYLSQTRHSNHRDDSLHSAFDAGLLTKEYFYDEDEDFILDTLTLSPPAETSWLAPGAVLSGCQHATTVTATISSTATRTATGQALHRFRNNESMATTLFDSSRPWPSHSYTSPHRRNVQTSGPETVTSHSPHQDRWPVKVTIHAVDYSKMSLSATMEAYNVPSHPHSHQLLASNSEGAIAPFTRTSSITTYLEGEILDFNQHTLLTESFKSDAHNDATYWRKLPPFQKFTDDELVRNLTSKRYLTEVLNKDWILMRWKERCFVKSLHRPSNAVQPPNSHGAVRPTDSFTSTTSSRENRPPREWQDNEHTTFDDSGCGLTISGFYYVCLRRSDGKLEGLYYDPQSSPYQCLKLDSVNGGVFPAWQFR